MSKKNNGFTLAELLVVVAIIAVLSAIAVPVFSGQLEKSREAADAGKGWLDHKNGQFGGGRHRLFAER